MSNKPGLLARMFGGKKEATPDSTSAIQKLRETEDMLTKKINFLEEKIKREQDLAKANATKNKRVALQALKRKKQYEQQLEKIYGTLTTIEFQRESLESAGTNTEVLKAMDYAAKALKGANSSMKVDNVHDIMDDIAEQHDVANEISDAISSPVGMNAGIDMDDLESELEGLEQEALDEKMLDIGHPSADVNLPSVPTTSLPVAGSSKTKKNKEEDDLAELEAWAS